MMYDYEPLTEEEAAKAKYHLLDEGIYDATVTKSTGRVSKNGNAMAELNLNVYDANGKIHTIKDYLVFTNNMIWKLKHFCDSAGLSKEYEEKKFTPELAENKNVKVSVKVQEGNFIPEENLKGKAPGAKYPDKNVIEDYIAGDKKFDGCFQLPKAEFINDDIPF